jgi:hypothetical protein
MPGIKNDNGKRRFSLLDIEAINGVIDIFEHGCEKYEENNWVSLSPVRIYDAMYRHLAAFGMGEWTDKDSGYPHLLHIVSNAFMLFSLTKKQKKFCANEIFEYEKQGLDNAKNTTVVKEWL